MSLVQRVEHRLGSLPAPEFAQDLERLIHEVRGELPPRRVPAAATLGFQPGAGGTGISPIPGFCLRASSRAANASAVNGVWCSYPVFSCSPRHRMVLPSRRRAAMSVWSLNRMTASRSRLR